MREQGSEGFLEATLKLTPKGGTGWRVKKSEMEDIPGSGSSASKGAGRGQHR